MECPAGKTGHFAHVDIHSEGKLLSVVAADALAAGKVIGILANVGRSEVEAVFAQSCALAAPVTCHGRLGQPVLQGLSQ